MTPAEMNIVKSLVAVAWADGTVKEPEQGIIDGLCWAFDASDEDDAEIREYARKKRPLDEAPLGDLDDGSRRLLLANAALLAHADGKQTKAEKKLLDKLIDLLGFSADEARSIVGDARARAGRLASKL